MSKEDWRTDGRVFDSLFRLQSDVGRLVNEDPFPSPTGLPLVASAFFVEVVLKTLCAVQGDPRPQRYVHDLASLFAAASESYDSIWGDDGGDLNEDILMQANPDGNPFRVSNPRAVVERLNGVFVCRRYAFAEEALDIQPLADPSGLSCPSALLFDVGRAALAITHSVAMQRKWK